MTKIFWGGILLVALFCTQNGYAKEFRRVGILFDGPYWWNEQMVDQIKHELSALNQGEFDILYPADAQFDGAYDVGRIREYAVRLADQVPVDLILAFGVEATKAFTHLKSLTRPVVAVGIDFPTLVGILDPKTYQPFQKNLTTIYDPAIEVSYANFTYQLVNSNQFTFLCPSFLCDHNPQLLEVLPDIVKKARFPGVRQSSVTVKVISPKNFSKEIQKLDTDVVIVGRLHGFADGEVKAVFDAITARKIPSISADGMYGTLKGALASLNDYDFKEIGRKVALKLHNIMRGTPPSKMTSVDKWKLELIYNQETARKIGYDIPLEFLYDAKVVGAKEVKEPLTLKKALDIAGKMNTDIAIKLKEVERANIGVKLARGGYFPRLSSNIQYTAINKQRADLQPSPRAETKLELGVLQNIFNQEINKTIESALVSADAVSKEAALTKQDVIEGVCLTYINYMLTQDIVEIRRQQLHLLKKHRDIAQLRFDLEETGKSDVLRLEIQYDQGRVELIRAYENMNKAKAALINLLNYPEEISFDLMDRKDFDEAIFKETSKIFEKYYRTERRLKLFREFLIQKAYENSVELAVLDTRIELAHKEKERILGKFWPSVTVGGSFFRQLSSEHRDLSLKQVPVVTGVDMMEPASPRIETVDLLLADENQIYEDGYKKGWQAQLKVNIPIYEGHTRFNQLKTAHTQIKELQTRKEKLKGDLAQNIRVLYYAHYTTRNNALIALRDESLARENLTLAEVAYREGSLAIIDLLDIQSSLVLTEINAIVMRYQYIQSIVKLFRAISRAALFAEDVNSPVFTEFIAEMDRYFHAHLPNFK